MPEASSQPQPQASIDQRRGAQPLQFSLLGLFLVVTALAAVLGFPAAAFMVVLPIALVVLSCVCVGVVFAKPQGHWLRQLCGRFTVLPAYTGMWCILSSIRSSDWPESALSIWFSIVAGPFAFIDPRSAAILHAPLITIAAALVLVALSICHPVRPRWYMVVPTLVGVTLWFLAGVVFTFVGR